MSEQFNVIITFTIGLLFYHVFSLDASTCIHDEVHHRNFLTAHQQYSTIPKDENGDKVKRSITDLYRPMRIHVHFSNLNEGLSPAEEIRLRNIVRQTTTLVSNILSVIPIDGKLLLARSDSVCTSVWLEGINKNKCSRVKYATSETCLDNFKIPPEHLQGLYIYNFTYPKPIEVVSPEGAGLQDKDYVLYVRSFSTSRCVSAVALHEFFHALGFSKDLFKNFRDCSQSETGLRCPTWQEPVREVIGTYRLVTPGLVKLASDHFNCTTHPSQNEFGPRLQVKGHEVGSHWDAAFMEGSLMAPHIGMPELTKLDPMTLTAFADMGWYKVNFNFAEDYVWGKGAGCSFGANPSCESEDKFFCKTNDNDTPKSGCHYLHEFKGFCRTNNFLHFCSTYEATSEGNCQVTSNQQHAKPHEKYQPDSRCFLSNLTQQGNDMTIPVARCYQHQCVDGLLEVKVGDSSWTSCPYGGSVEIGGFLGAVYCPMAGVLCQPPRQMPVATDIPIPTKDVPKTTVNPRYSGVTYRINVTFPNTNYVWLLTQQLIPDFKEQASSAISRLTKVSRQRIMNVILYRIPVVTYSFELLPAMYADDGPSSDIAYELLIRSVARKQLSVIVADNDHVYTAASVHRFEGGPTLSSDSLSAGVIAGMVIGCILAALVLGALVFFVQRYYALHARVLPSHSRYEDSQALSNQRPLPDPEAAQWAAAERAHSALSTHDIHVDDQSSQFDMNDSL